MQSPIGTWGASPAAPTYFIPLEFMPQPEPIQGTIRYRLRVSTGGTSVRLRLSNEVGERFIVVGAVSIGLASAHEAAIQTGMMRQVTFSQQHEVHIAAGAVAVSDPIELSIADLGDVIVSLYLPMPHVPAQGGDTHRASVSAGQDSTLALVWPAAVNINARPIVTALTVIPASVTRTVVTLGDSITDGSTDHVGCLPYMFRGWPDILAGRLVARATQTKAQDSGAIAYSVVNAGIGGNRLLADFIGPNALARLDRDVFSVPGVSHLVVFEGINDIGIGGRTIDNVLLPMTTADELINAFLQIIERAHEQGIKVIGATLPPFRDAFYFLEEKEVVRQAVNAWIRSAAKFDGLIDFDRVLRDPQEPSRLRSDYDTGDHLHPNMAAFAAMGNAIDLDFFAPFDAVDRS
jgi:lysophospholipase L1-like esterase